jgi:putative N6-adenine-specific DNA methylase
MPPVELEAGQAGLMILNPPYGERIETGGFSKTMTVEPAADGQAADGQMGKDFFSLLATHWKQNFTGWTGWILTPDLKLPTRMRLKESRRVPMWNGPIECRLFKFDMVKGTAREPKV